ncbi:MAG: hypothetical protein ACYSU3_13030 [Planctomycetota bacterium]
MAYNCVVLIKQVPDTKRITGQAMNDDGTKTLMHWNWHCRSRKNMGVI